MIPARPLVSLARYQSDSCLAPPSALVGMSAEESNDENVFIEERADEGSSEMSRSS